MIAQARRAAGGIFRLLRAGADPFVDLVLGAGQLACNVCGRAIRKFHPLPRRLIAELKRHGWPYAPEQAETCNYDAYTCPHCGATDRDRLIAMYLDEYFRERSGERPLRFLDIAPSRPLSAWVRRSAGGRGLALEYRTADLFAQGVDDRVNLTDMALYPAGAWDVFVCSHVLEHVPDDRKALGELYRILAPGGCGVLLVPIVLGLASVDEDPALTHPGERWRRFGQDDHVRLYSKGGFVGRVREAGFGVRELGGDHFGLPRFSRHGVTARSVLYVAEKPGGRTGPPAGAAAAGSAR